MIDFYFLIYLKVYKTLMNLIRNISLVRFFLSIFITWRTHAMTDSHDVNTCVIVLRPFDYLITDCQNMG